MKKNYILLLVLITIINTSVYSQLFIPEQLLGITNVGSHFPSDLDGDGDIDIILSIETDYLPDHKIIWVENINNEFSTEHIICLTPYDNGNVITTIDIDNDGDNDIVIGFGEGNLSIYENTDGNGNFELKQVLSTNYQWTSISNADYTGNGFVDIVACENAGNLIWFENNEDGTFLSGIVISSDVEGGPSVYSVDINNDGNIDIISSSMDNNKVAWYKNNGYGNFESESIISNSLHQAQSIYAADIDGDNYIDVLSVSFSTNKIVWFKNMDGQGNFGSEHLISDSYSYPQKIITTDIDDDNDIDVFVSTTDELVFFENLNGLGTSFAENTYSGMQEDIHFADINNDGNLDITDSYGELTIFYNNYSPVITENILNQAICNNESATFEVITEGYNLNYQWQVNNGSGFEDIINGTEYSGASESSLIINSVTTSMNNNYRCIVYSFNYLDSVISNSASLTVLSLPITSFSTTPSVLTSENSVITYTGETSSNDNFVWNFDGATSNPTGIGPHNVNWVTGGLKTIELTVTNDNGCISTIISQNVEVTPKSNFTISLETCKNTNTTITYTSTSSPTATYIWDFDDAITNPTGQGPHDISWNTIGTKTITLTVEENGYTSTETTHQIVVNSLPIIDMDASLNICHNQTDIITPIISNGITPYSYNWSNGESTPTITVNDVVEDYYLKVTDNNGCIATDVIHTNIFYPYSNQQLCLVSVDPATGKNKIVWEPNENVGTESYIINKASSTNNYTPLDIINVNEPNEFIDWGSDPAAHADFYKITVVDTCGNQSEIEDAIYHKTINLTLSHVASTMSLNWEQYEVEDGSFVPSKYYIYRGTSPTNMSVLDSVNGMLRSYNDLNIYQEYYYMVGAVRNGCNSGNKSINASYSIFSNQKNNKDFIGIIERPDYMPIQIYPNPAKDQIQLSIGDLQLKESKVIITDISGKEVKQFKIQNSEFKINIEDIETGTYFLTIKGDKIYKGKFVKE